MFNTKMGFTVVWIVGNMAAIVSAEASCCEDLGWGGGMYHSPLYGVGSTGSTMSFGGSAVCAQSKIGGSCSSTLSFFAAAAFCESGGGRLCTAEEVLNDDAHGSG